jgi:hypothetical protein
MREQEMRLRVFRFLKARMRNMIMPATVGIGLAVGGCAKEGTGTAVDSAAFQDSAVSNQNDSALIQNDTGQAKNDVFGPESLGPGPDLALADAREAQAAGDVAADAARDVTLSLDTRLGTDVAKSDVSTSEAGKLDALASVDSGSDLGTIGGKDIAPIPDAASRDAADDLGTIITKYIAPTPDAAADTGGIAPVYIASTPDAAVGNDVPAVRYMAQIPIPGAGSKV